MFVFYFFFLFFFISTEEVDKLRSEWRDKIREYNDLMTDIKRFDDDIKNENMILKNLNRLKTFMGTLDNKFTMFVDDDVEDQKFYEKKTKLFEELEEIKNRAELKYEQAKETLREKEVSMESLWNNELFIKSFDFILKSSLLTPVPRFPLIQDIDMKKTQEKRMELVGMERKILGKRTEQLREINLLIFRFEEIFKDFNFFGPVLDRLEMLKTRVLTMKMKDVDKQKLMNFIDLYQKNNKNELDSLEQKNWNGSKMKLKQYLDSLISNDRWKLRLGHIKNVSASVTNNNNKNDVLIGSNITSVSRTGLDTRTRQHYYTQLIKYNDEEKMKYVALIGENKIYKFMLRKCAKMVEAMHKYLVKAEDKEVKGLYDEIVNEL